MQINDENYIEQCLKVGIYMIFVTHTMSEKALI